MPDPVLDASKIGGFLCCKRRQSESYKFEHGKDIAGHQCEQQLSN